MYIYIYVFFVVLYVFFLLFRSHFGSRLTRDLLGCFGCLAWLRVLAGGPTRTRSGAQAPEGYHTEDPAGLVDHTGPSWFKSLELLFPKGLLSLE